MSGPMTESSQDQRTRGRVEGAARDIAAARVRDEPERPITDALAADLDGLREWLDEWIARQDAKAARR